MHVKDHWITGLPLNGGQTGHHVQLSSTNPPLLPPPHPPKVSADDVQACVYVKRGRMGVNGRIFRYSLQAATGFGTIEKCKGRGGGGDTPTTMIISERVLTTFSSWPRNLSFKKKTFVPFYLFIIIIKQLKLANAARCLHIASSSGLKSARRLDLRCPRHDPG